MAKQYAVYICGGDTRPGPRGTDCPNAVHDHPLPAGYVDAHEQAARRLYKRWKNVKCKACGFHGWIPPVTVSQPTRALVPQERGSLTASTESATTEEP